MSSLDSAKEYWTISRRFHQHRDNPVMRPTAVRDMVRLQNETQSQAVLARVNRFIGIHHRNPRSNSPNGGGGRVA